MSIPLYRQFKNEQGEASLEFTLVLPVLFLILLGFGDIAYDAYLKQVLSGAVEKAARDSTIQDNATQSTAIDKKVEDMVRAIAPAATFSSSRSNYDNYGAVGPEPFDDTNGNGKRDTRECFSDVNGNTKWDADAGISGQGGASDVVLYTMTVHFPRLFPLAALMDQPAGGDQLITSASTILRNQPYAAQTVTAVQTLCN